MQCFNDTSLLGILWNDRIYLCFTQAERKSFYLHLSPSVSSSLWLHAYNPGAAQWACSMGNYSLQYSFSVLVNSQGRSTIEKVYLFQGGRWIWPQGKHHNKPSFYRLYGLRSVWHWEMSTCFPATYNFVYLFFVIPIWMLFFILTW